MPIADFRISALEAHYNRPPQRSEREPGCSIFCFGAAVWRQVNPGPPPPQPELPRIPTSVLVGLSAFLTVISLSALVAIWLPGRVSEPQRPLTSPVLWQGAGLDGDGASAPAHRRVRSIR